MRRTSARLVVLAAVLGFAGCAIFSLDGLTGGTAPVDASWTGSDVTTHPDAGATDAPLVDRAEASPSPSLCDGGLLLCDGACVDPATDPANCNGCGNACATGACGTTLTESLATAPTTWTFNGSATYNTFAPSAELTPIQTNQAGTFVYDNPVTIDAFDAQFDFRMGLGGGTRADGMGFMIEQSGRQAVGGTGAGLGMTGLKGYGAELDLYDNAVCGDTSGDHVGVDDLTLCDAIEGTPTSLFASGSLTASVDLGDAHWHHGEVALASGALTVSVDGTAIAKAVSLPKLQTGAPYYLGFAAGTGGLTAAEGGASGYRQEVKNIVITFPTPRCL